MKSAKYASDSEKKRILQVFSDHTLHTPLKGERVKGTRFKRTLQ